jgi:hypothetical protein
MFLLDPVDPSKGPLGMADLSVDDPDRVLADWASAIQSIRMIDRNGRATWSEQPRMWSVACYGLDQKGRFVMIHARSPWTMHTFIGIVQGLGLDLVGLQYGEGGPEATLYSKVGAEQEWVGSYETGFFESDLNRDAWPVPNVIAVFPR